MPETSLSEPIGTLARALVHLLSATPAAIPLLALPVAAWLCYRAWARAGDRRATRSITGLVLVLGLVDGLLLAALPRLGLSFGPVGLPWLGLILARAGLAQGFRRIACRWLPGRLAAAASLLWGLNLAILAGEVYALCYEPFNLGVSQVDIALPEAGQARLRIVHLADLHIERMTRRERAVLETVAQLEPDLILLTGDYLNLSYVDGITARRDAREFLGRLQAPYGVYAVSGSPPVDTVEAMESLFGDLAGVTVLRDQVVDLELQGQTIRLVGIGNLGLQRDRQALRALMGQRLPGAYTILLYHTPDLAEAAAEQEVDLYLAGHTHGGQVRLPGFGALVTASRYGKRYEAGLYQVGPTQLYVSRGLGTEGLGAPRVRFLCPPEIVDLMLGHGDQRPGALTAPSRCRVSSPATGGPHPALAETSFPRIDRTARLR